MYYYQVASVNGSGTSSYSQIGQACPAPNGESSLYELRLQAQQMADRVGGDFVTTNEWNDIINRAMFELYDILVTSYEDYFVASPIHFISTGSQNLYALPNGSNTFLSSANATVTPPAFYKLLGVDMGLNTNNNAYATMRKFNFNKRNTYFYPTSGGTVYGVFNMQYRVMGANIEFIPTPTGGQPIQLWYIPRMTKLLQDTDITSIGVSGWTEYIVVRAAIYALSKEESDVSHLESQLLFLKQRIEEAAQNRDSSMPDTISDTGGMGPWGAGGFGSNSPVGGY